jgi:membrane-associated protein
MGTPRASDDRRAMDAIGGAFWVATVTRAGYLVGYIPWVQEQFDKIILGLLGATVPIALLGAWRGKVVRRMRRGP